MSSLILCNNNEPFLSQNTDQIVTCYEKWIVYDNQWLAQWLYWDVPKHSSKRNLHQKKVMVSVWWSVAGLIRYNFVNPGDTITFEKYAQQIDEMCWKLQHLQPALVNRKGPILLHNNAQPHVTQPRYKSWTNWSTKFCLICLIHLTFLQLTTTFSSILTTFCREDSSITSRRQKMF